MAGMVMVSAQTTPDPGPAKEEADKQIFEAVCGSCHPTTLFTDLRTEPEWVETVEHMVKLGAKGSEEQLEAVLRVLLHTLTKVNVNAASAREIAPVLDIDEATAQAVVEYRGAHGRFKSLDDLKKVPGVNAATLDARGSRVAF